MSNTTENVSEINTEAEVERNDTTKRIEAEVFRIISWENPLRSGAILLLSISAIVLSRSYSLIQIVSGLCTLATSINLIYVGFIKLSQRVISDAPPSNPYQSRLKTGAHEKLFSRDSIVHYTYVVVDVAETIIRAFSRILLIEDAVTSIKWLAIFYTVWKVSSHVSSAYLVMTFIISAFIFPRLYLSNKDIVDARLQQGHSILCTQVRNIQSAAIDGFENMKGLAQNYMNKPKAE